MAITYKVVVVQKYELLYATTDDHERAVAIAEGLQMRYPDVQVDLRKDVFLGPGEKCITPTGRTDCHGMYVKCSGDELVCTFCNEKL